MSDKYSGALHAGGVKKGGTGDETINNVVNFARSNVGNIKKNSLRHGDAVHWDNLGLKKMELHTQLPQHIDQTTTKQQRLL